MNKYRKNNPVITLRVSEEDRESLRQRASELDMYLEEYCRLVLLGKRVSVEPKKRGRPTYYEQQARR
jgi:predicted DNA binding CopG/RHH family protein